MTPPTPPTKRLQRLFARRKCWMLSQLTQALGYALISVRRFLKQIGYFRSYTHNGKWYTLSASPDFDHEGLWHYRGIGFSKHGSLTATIDHLVGRSPAGLSAGELTQKLQHPCHAVLSQLHNSGRLDRLRLAGQFRYLVAEPRLNRQQRERATLVEVLSPTSALTTQTALRVLVEHVKEPGLSFEQLACRLQKQHNLAVAPLSIERFFQQHGLKRTPQAPN